MSKLILLSSSPISSSLSLYIHLPKYLVNTFHLYIFVHSFMNILHGRIYSEIHSLKCRQLKIFGYSFVRNWQQQIYSDSHLSKKNYIRYTLNTTYIAIYGRESVDRIATQSMSKICNFWRLIVGHCDYAEI